MVATVRPIFTCVTWPSGRGRWRRRVLRKVGTIRYMSKRRRSFSIGSGAFYGSKICSSWPSVQRFSPGFDLKDARLGDPITWNRGHKRSRDTPMIRVHFLDRQDVNEAGDCELVWVQLRSIRLHTCGANRIQVAQSRLAVASVGVSIKSG